ncbi:MAG: S-layer homology domain-containing protein [Armatimonadota bacterium]
MASRRDGQALRSLGWLALLLAVAAVPVLATSGVLSDWKAYYPASTLGTTYSCQLCHGSSTSTFNSYGQSIRTAWSGGGTVEEAFAAVEGLDPDSDGYSSEVEIAANTHPGDASSHPSGDSTPPSAPTNLTATAISSSRIDLAWTASTDNVGVAHYNVYRGSTLLAQPATTNWSNTGLSPGTSYQYHVTAVDAADNESGMSNVAYATTLAAATYGASVVSADLPASMIRDSTAPASITLENTGSTTWTAASGFALGAQSPADNTIWGMSRIALGGGDSITTGYDKTFAFTLTAPHAVGLRSCNWQMVQDGGTGWFGEIASSQIEVISFSDVPMSYWDWSAIEAVSAAGIAQGFDGSPPTYQPTLPVNRDQMAVFLARAVAGSDAEVPAGPATATFADVPTNHWAFRHIEYAVDQGIVAGYDDQLYHPEYAVDRGQMAVFIARSIAVPVGEAGLVGYTPPASPTFPDVPTDFWSYKHIEYIADPARAVTGGYDDGLYHPEFGCSRDQMAAFIQRAFKLAL